MKTLSYILLIPVIFIFSSCGGKTEQNASLTEEEIIYPVVIPFEKGVNTEQEITLSQIAEKVEFIPLETTDKSLIARQRTILSSMDHFYIPCRNGVYQFNKKGKFVGEISKKGQGPGEYSYFMHTTIDEKNNRFYLLANSNKGLIYTLNGEYIEQIPLAETATQLGIVNDSTIATYIYNTTGQQKESVILLNLQGDILNKFPQHDQFMIEGGQSFMIMGSNDRFLSSFNNMLLLKESYSDTIFVVEPEELLPRYIIEMGKYKLPVEYRFERIKDRSKYNDIAKDYLFINPIETEGYLIIPYNPWYTETEKDRGLVLFNKKDQSIFKSKNGEIKNDLSGKLPFIPQTNISDNQLISVWEVSKIFELAENDPSILEYEAFRELKEDDNPVLMVVTLK